GFLMIVVDMTIVNVALPSIRRDLGFSQAGLAWVVNAYLIAYGGLLLLGGRLGDLIGRKRIFLIGLALFTAASLLCGLSFSQPMLIAARFIQGIGGAVSSAVILGMVVTMFPEPGERARAIGIFSFVASAGATIGLLAGGFITQAISWHWIFFVNLPIGLATALVAARLLDADSGIGLREGADVVGAVLVTAALMLGVYTIVESATYGLGSLRTLGFSAVALALLGAFLVRQTVARNPILPLRLFRSRNLSGANVIQALMTVGMFGMFFLGSLDLERILHYRPLAIGLAFLPVAVAMGSLSIGVSARLIMRFGARHGVNQPDRPADRAGPGHRCSAERRLPLCLGYRGRAGRRHHRACGNGLEAAARNRTGRLDRDRRGIGLEGRYRHGCDQVSCSMRKSRPS